MILPHMTDSEAAKALLRDVNESQAQLANRANHVAHKLRRSHMPFIEYRQVLHAHRTPVTVRVEDGGWWTYVTHHSVKIVALADGQKALVLTRHFFDRLTERAGRNSIFTEEKLALQVDPDAGKVECGFSHGLGLGIKLADNIFLLKTYVSETMLGEKQRKVVELVGATVFGDNPSPLGKAA